MKGSTGTRLALCCTAWIISDNLQSYIFSCSSFESGCGPWQKFGNLLHILRSRTNPVRCDRIWIECKILAASNAFCQLYILFVFLAGHPGRWREASYLQISVSAKISKTKLFCYNLKQFLKVWGTSKNHLGPFLNAGVGPSPIKPIWKIDSP